MEGYFSKNVVEIGKSDSATFSFLMPLLVVVIESLMSSLLLLLLVEEVELEEVEVEVEVGLLGEGA